MIPFGVIDLAATLAFEGAKAAGNAMAEGAVKLSEECGVAAGRGLVNGAVETLITQAGKLVEDFGTKTGAAVSSFTGAEVDAGANGRKGA